jgi:hypothetical protein
MREDEEKGDKKIKWVQRCAKNNVFMREGGEEESRERTAQKSNERNQKNA